jgi:membrane associated rhomboid family serine protease
MTLWIAIAIVAVFAAEFAGDGMALCQQYGFVATAPTLRAALSATFLHANLRHVGGNVVALVFFGAVVERDLGHLRVVVLYFLGSIGAAAFHVMANPESLVPEVGASGPIFALLAAAAVLRPRLVGFVATFAAINVWETVTGTGGEVATAAHLGGFSAGFVVTAIVFRRRLAEVRGWGPSRKARPAGAIAAT